MSINAENIRTGIETSIRGGVRTLWRLTGRGRLLPYLVRHVHREMSFAQARVNFIEKAGEDAGQRDRRVRIVKRFDLIHKRLPVVHTYSEMLYVAEAALGLVPDGPMVECGSYQGGSSAKLSVLAELTGRELYICDSFEGLPEPKEGERVDQSWTTHGRKWEKSEYAGPLETVKGNIAQYGAPDLCRFVKGYFKDSLLELDIRPALVYADVDLVSSYQDCLAHLWGKMPRGSIFFFHEAGLRNVVAGVLDEAFWRSHFDCPPPQLYGALFGMGYWSHYLQFMVKDAPLDQERLRKYFDAVLF